MSKDYLNDYSTTASSNTDVGGVNINENCPPSGINNGVREVMSHLAGLNAELDVGADVASATALLINIPGMTHDVTGTTTITSFAEATNDTSRTKILQFDDALTLTHHATNLILPGSANITTAAGDIGIFYQYAAGDWRCISYLAAAIKPGLLDEDNMSSDSAAQGSTQQSIKAYVDGKAPIEKAAWASFNGTGTPALDDSYNVSSITDNGTGNYTINFSNDFSSTGYAVSASGTRGAGLDENTHIGARATGSVVVYSYRSSTGGLVDRSGLSVSVLGD